MSAYRVTVFLRDGRALSLNNLAAADVESTVRAIGCNAGDVLRTTCEYDGLPRSEDPRVRTAGDDISRAFDALDRISESLDTIATVVLAALGPPVAVERHPAIAAEFDRAERGLRQWAGHAGL